MHKRTIILTSSTLAACAAAIALLWLVGGGLSARAALALSTVEAPADELRVCATCAYQTVQAAVDAAIPGDVIKVAQGAYTDIHVRTGITQVVYITKSVTIRGGYTTTNWTTPYPITQPTTLDAQGQGRVLYIIGDISPTIEGLRVTGGDAAGLGGEPWGSDVGGGIYVITATAAIDNNQVFSNTAHTGGGLYLRSSNTTLSDNTVYSNTAFSGGGGLDIIYGQATLYSNTVSGNNGGWGGGLHLISSDATLSGNTFTDNNGNWGGGVNLDGSTVTLNGNTISGNTAYGAGGVYVYISEVTFNGDIVSGNTASSGGGGMWIYRQTPELVNVVVADNILDYHTGYGAGIYVESSLPRLLHTTIARNSGGDGSGVYATDYGSPYSTVTLTNTVIVSHSAGIIVTAGNTATLNTTLWHGNTTNWDGTGTVNHTNDRSGDPAFALDGYHLITGSMAIDRGVNAGVTTDVDGDTRPQGAGYDIGADEFPAASPDVAWDKQLRINGGSFQTWDSGPFTVAPGDVITIVERAWVTTTGNVSFTLGEAWTPSLEWVTCEATTGTVSQSGLTATWSVTNAAPNAWHVLTKTLRVAASPEYADTLTETLTVQGLAIQLPERIIEFQHPRPQPAWDKAVRVNDDAPQAWDTGPFTVAPGDVVTVVDRVWITHTTDVVFTLAQVWGQGLNLDGWDYDAGAVTTSTGTLTWHGTGELANQWHTLTTTLRVTGTTWLYESVTETLTVEGAAPQPPQRVVNLLNLSASTGCYARVNDGSTTYPTIQSAVDAAQPGDLVKVAGYCADVNHYGGLAQVVYLDESLTIRGGYTTTNWTTPDPSANPTTLDAQGQGRVLYIIGNISPIIEGLRITGGDAAGLGGTWWGEGVGGAICIYNATAVISGNHVYSSTAAAYGGGLYLESSSAILNSNHIYSNTVNRRGGGLYLNGSDATLSGNTIYSNAASIEGGGVCLYWSDATLNNNTIYGNTSASEGGGLYVYGGAATLNGNVVTGNTAYRGGGLYLMYLWDSPPTLVNTVVAGNQANQGSGLWFGGSYSPSTIRLLHTTIADNVGSGQGVFVGEYTTLAFTNTIIVSHTVGISVTAGSTATLNGTLWHANIGGNWGGAGSISTLNDHTGDPAFAPDGYHLTDGSAAIDRGVNAGVTTDIDGESRPQGAGYDLGADELPVRRVYLPLVVRGF